MKTVTFLQTSHDLASARLRNAIPRAELAKRGWGEGNDIIVLSKHNWEWTDDIRRKFGAVVFDVCDDWFDTPEYGAHYRHVCSMADAVTCNSEAMRERIEEVTGRRAKVIDDPWETPELPPGAGDGVLWFGNKKGLPDLHAALERIEYPVTIVSDVKAPWSLPWSLGMQAAALERCRCVFVPPTPMKCRSANRAITAIRAGRMVVAGDIPSYRDIPGIFVGDDFLPGLNAAMSEDMHDRIAAAQSFVRERFSPDRITDQWETALCELT